MPLMFQLDNSLDSELFVNVENLKNNLCEIIEFLASTRAKSVIENNISHLNTSLFDHSMYVLEKFQKLLKLKFIHEEETRVIAKDYFSSLISERKRAELLLLSAPLHDLGKLKALKKNRDGVTSASGHEKVSVKLASGVLERIGLNKGDLDYLREIIRLHSGFSLRFLSYLKSLNRKDLEQALHKPILLPEVFFYMIADNEKAESFREYKIFILDRILNLPSVYKSKLNSWGEAEKKKIGELLFRIQQKVYLNSKPWPLNIRLFHLGEEIGELYDVYLQFLGAKDREQTIKDLENGLNDVLTEILAIYYLLGLDLNKSLKKIICEYES